MTAKQRNWRRIAAAFCRWCLVWLSIGLFTFLAGINLLRTAFMDMNRESSRRELVLYGADRPLRFLIVFAVALIVTLLLQRWWSAADTRMSRAVHAALFLAWGAFGVWWIWNIGVEPSADQANILWAASRFAENDFTYLHHGQYLFRYPHQLYVTAFLELFLRMVGPDNPYRVQLLRLFNLAAALWAMYVAARLYRQEFAENDTFKKNDAAIILFGGGVLFSTFIYGNIPSMALAFTALWLQLQWQREEGRPGWKLLLSAVCITLAVLLKSFALILLVAQCIVLAVWVLRTGRWRALCFVLAAVVMIQGSQWGIRQLYGWRDGQLVNEGPGMLTWAVMGLQSNWEGWRAPGWYNNYNWDTYEECGFDHDATVAMAKADLQKRLERFAGDPAYTKNFFLKKTYSQWAEPTYQCFWINQNKESGQPTTSLMEAVCADTPLNARLVEWMNQYQSLIWVCGAWYLWHKRKNLQMEQLLPALAIFGGFLFQLVWEGKSQYILQYFMLALPYGAAGLNEMAAALKIRLLKPCSGQGKTAKAS